MPQIRKPVAAFVGAAAILALASCSQGTAASSGETNAGGESIEYGADKQAYIDALVDMEPVEIVIQSTAAKGAATGRRFEDYAAAVEEWSGGKITFEFAYASAIAPPNEVHLAIADGRIDVGSVMPALSPSDFPASNALGDISHLGSQLPVDWMLEWNGIMLDTVTAVPDIDAEFEAKGMKLLLPLFGSGAYMPYCSEPGQDWAGAGIATQSLVQNREAEALGLTPTSISYAEMFEGLERGVIDCAISTVTGAAVGGYIEAVPYLSYSPDVGFNAPGGSIAISLDKWNSLPLPAQQLMFDRIDIMMQANFEGAWENTAAAVDAVEAAGGAFQELDAASVDALRELHTEVQDEIAAGTAVEDGQALVDAGLSAEERWHSALADFEGVGTSYEDFPAWWAQGAPDLQGYFDELWAGSMGERRPE